MQAVRYALWLTGIAIITGSAAGLAWGAPTPQEIVRKSVYAIKEDWAAAPRYSYIERDVESKKSAPAMAKTYRVLMIEGSPYNLVTAMNDEPLSSDDKAQEQRKLQREMARRHNESERERRRRVAKYEKEREHDHEMLQQMAAAFEFRLSGEAQVDGHKCWVLDAEPRPGYEAQNHEGRVLKGMRGKLWVDEASYQWVKVHAEVVRPVSFYGFLAKVGPGTEFDLEQEPVGGGLWMPKAFHMRVRASALGFLSENSNENDTYREYQPMPQALALLQSTK